MRITSAAAISFILNYRMNNRERRYTIGRHPDWSLVSARNEALKLRSLIAQGMDPLDERRRDRDAPTVKDLGEDYIERHAKPYKRESSVHEDKAMLTGIIIPKLGSLQVHTVTRRDVETLHQSLQGTPYRANRVLPLVSKMFSLAVQWGWRADNPARGVPKFPEDKRERWLTEAELDRLASALDAFPAERAAGMTGERRQKAIREATTMVNAVRLMTVTGARKGEVLQATWDQFDFDRGIWTKPSHHTKQKRTERVPLIEQALALLASIPKETALLFPGRRDGQPLAELKTAWSEIKQAAKLPDVRLHDLRHSFASHLVSSGVSLSIVGRLLGHTQPQTTARYAHVADSPLREAANRFPGLMTAKTNGQTG